MVVIKAVAYAVLSLFILSTANPIRPSNVEARNLFQIEPSHAKRTLFNVDNISSEDQRTFLRDAQKEAVDIADVALRYMDDPKYADFRKRWFGVGDDVNDDIRGVLTNFVGDNKNGEGSIVLGDVKVWQSDYWLKDPLYCDRTNKDGKTGTAYYTPTNKNHAGPSMHYCDKFYTRKSKQDYLANNCGSIATHIDTDTTTRMYRGANVMHEFMHFEKVGAAQTGAFIADFAYGAYNSYVYKSTKDAKDPKSRPTLNADTYVFYAMHIWLSVECKRDFSFPRDERDN